jgi:sporulation protein YlmC with PRC-barrel domain
MIKLFLAPVALISISSAALAQDQSAGTGARAAIYQGLKSLTEDPPQPVSAFVESQAAGQLLASDFIGRTIFDPDGMEIGAIDDVLFDESGKLSVIVVNVSKLIGSHKRIAINLADLRRMEEGSNLKLIAGLKRAEVDKAPDFTSLSEEMMLNDGQSLTEDEATGTAPAASPK